MTNDAKIECMNIWKLFGSNPDHAFRTLDPKLTRAEAMQQSGHLIGVRDVSFQVFPGETFVIMGLSGSGKSTLVRCLSRLMEPTSGRILIDGQDVTGLTRSRLAELRRYKMAMVFQHFGLYPHLTVLENVAFGLEIRGEGRQSREEKAMQSIEMVGLIGWENLYPRELSGGMQQRVGLARAMAVDPEIMFFDEPFSALDPLIRREMQDELIDIQERLHKTMVFITHDFAEAIKLGDRIAIMKDGEIVQTGTPEDIVANPANQYVREFVEDVPRQKVLTAASIMRETRSEGMDRLHQRGCGVSGSTRLEELVEPLIRAGGVLPVIGADKAVIGEVDQSLLLRAINARTGDGKGDAPSIDRPCPSSRLTH